MKMHELLVTLPNDATFVCLFVYIYMHLMLILLISILAHQVYFILTSVASVHLT